MQRGVHCDGHAPSADDWSARLEIVTSATQRLQVDQNYDFFQRRLCELLREHRDEYALIRDREIVAFHRDIGEAYRDALSRFPDRIFSIQEVSEEPVDLGIFSHAGN